LEPEGQWWHPASCPWECRASANSLGPLFVVDVHGHEDTLANDQRPAIRLESAEEATAVAFVAYAGPESFNEEKHSIRVTIDAHLPNAEDVAAGLALLPKAIAGAREKVDLAGALGLFQRLGIDVAKHQDFTAAVVLNHSRNESAEFFKCQFHDCLPKNKRPAGRFAPAGQLELYFKKSASQTSRGAARSRDD